MSAKEIPISLLMERAYVLFLSVIAITLGIIIITGRGLHWNAIIVTIIIFLAIVTILLSIERPILWLSFMILSLAIFPNSSILAHERIIGTTGIRLFPRYLGGLLNLWDVFLLILILLSFLYRRRLSLIKVHYGVNRWLVPIYCILIFAMVNGFIRATILPYGETDIRNVIQSSLPSIYFILTYLSMRQIILHYRQFYHLIDILYICSVILLVIGVILILANIRGHIHLTTGFAGIGITLYDQLMFLSPIIGFIFIKSLIGQRQGRFAWVVFGLSIFFLLISTRRLVFILLILNLGAYLFVTAYATHWKIFRVRGLCRMTKIAVVIVFVISIMSYFLVPNLVKSLKLVIESVNIYSEIGLEYAGSSRIAEIENMFLNMNQSKESYLIGMGIGTKFFEFTPMGYDIMGDTGYNYFTMEKARTGWYPGFHLPFISGVFRFGFLGLFLISTFTAIWLFQWIHIARQIRISYLPYVIPLSILCAEAILGLGDSLNSAGPSFAGILLALLSFCYRAELQFTNKVQIMQSGKKIKSTRNHLRNN